MQVAISGQDSGSGVKRDVEPLQVAVIGNPNSGKTTIFNALTGLRYKVANYPGVTVERKEGKCSLNDEVECRLIDLPGIYTLSGESIDEQVAAKAVLEPLDALIVVVDSANLERNLFIVSELIDLGIPLVLGLNMTDLSEQRGIKINSALLSRLLDLPVVSLAANKKVGLDALRRSLLSVLSSRRISAAKFQWAGGDQELIDRSLVRERLDHPANYGAVASARYRWINSIVKRSVVSTSLRHPELLNRLDNVLTHRVYGLLIFALLMGIIFQSIFAWAAVPMDLIDNAINGLGGILADTIAAGPLRSLLIDGVLAGVGSVVIFVPQIALLFFFIGLLEDSGYLCRAAFVMDRVMRKFGLQGRSFIPLLSSFACAVPGIMATRSISSLADRFLTILVAPLMSCSARLPVYAVLIAAFIPDHTVLGMFSLQGLVMLGLYLMGIMAAAMVAWGFKKLFFRGEPALFVMEMPMFRVPSLTLVLRGVYDRVLVFLKSAGTVIFACSIVLWFLASHPLQNGQAPLVEESYAGEIGRAIEPLIQPLGFDWRIGIGLFASFAAREVFISSLSTVYNLESESESSESLIAILRKGSQHAGGFTLPVALALLVFYVFACQCMSTLAVCRRETGSWRWPTLMFVYMTALAYLGALVTFRVSRWLF
ncbi:MAG: ferrous iron transport protein B [Bdellovibrionales bacterium]|nr:ferrous iron transport protein B [Bdellovibrionales bacterium]